MKKKKNPSTKIHKCGSLSYVIVEKIVFFRRAWPYWFVLRVGSAVFFQFEIRERTREEISKSNPVERHRKRFTSNFTRIIIFFLSCIIQNSKSADIKLKKNKIDLHSQGHYKVIVCECPLYDHISTGLNVYETKSISDEILAPKSSPHRQIKCISIGNSRTRFTKFLLSVTKRNSEKALKYTS